MAPAKPGTARPTIHTVADRAGVSKSLVSLVLQGSASVSPEKRAAVQEAMRQLGYRPSATARRLRERRSHAIGVLVTDMRQPWYIEMVEGLNAVIAGHGFHMLLGDARLDAQVDGSVTRTYHEMGVDGLILAGSQALTPLIREIAAQVPTVATGSRDVDIPYVDAVANDDRAGGALATQHLLDLGHRRIACIAGTLPDAPYTVGRLRREGYEATMTAAGLADLITVVETDITEEGGYRAAVRLLSASSAGSASASRAPSGAATGQAASAETAQGADAASAGGARGPAPTGSASGGSASGGGARGAAPTALVCANDLVALGAAGAARELGLSVPDQLSIVGYDNSYVAGLRSIWLTSIDGAANTVGRQAANVLLARMGEPARPAELVLVPPSLHRRGTTAAPPSRGPA